MGRGAAGGRPPHLARVGAAIPAGVPSPARRAPRNRRRPPNAAFTCAPRYGGAIRPPRGSPGGMPPSWPDHAGAEGPPNASFSSAAGRFHEARRASARDRVIHNAQVIGRASGVCCERCWAAGVGMRNVRGSGCPVCPAARYVRRSGCPVCPATRYVRRSGCPVCPVCPAVRLPGMSGCPVCPAARYVRRSGCPVCPAARYVRLPGCPVCPAVRYARLPGMPGCPAARLFDGALRVEGSPTTCFSSAAGRFDRRQRAMARGGALHNAQVLGRASGVCCERGWAAGLAAGRRAGRPPHMRAVRAAAMAGCTALARRAPHPTAPARRSRQEASHAPAARSGPRCGAGGAPRACPGAYGLRDRPTLRLNCAAGSFDRWHG